MTDSVWSVLSAINCSEHVEKKGQFSYLAWTWAWAMVKENYPEAEYHIEDDIVYPDGTMEVRVMVSIGALTHIMWLPVLDFKNKAIQHPNAFDVNSARMRVLVKCLAMFGLGHYIYAGESAPQEPPAPPLSEEEWTDFLAFVAEKDGLGLLKYMADLGEEKCNEAYNKAPKGQKMKFKQSVTDVQNIGQATINDYVSGFVAHISNEDSPGVQELVSELSEDAWLKGQVWARLGDVEKHQITVILKGA